MATGKAHSIIHLTYLDHATKMIAKIRQCDIVVRDTNRIHRFNTNGQCSCQDRF
jgi:hypothetical protein